ncbi:MAG: anhydro-N-acetylmuramic acid kinase, partial [Bacteroidetes bacterium]|nr:anhydro-N-acetylmuramic acid kinase [Bacteroidota bacterium]
MLSHNFSAIGLMSGTSLDGLDICYTKFEQYTEHLCYQIIKAQTIRYTKEWENRLKNAIHLSPEELLQLNVEYGFLLGQLVKDFIDNNTIENIDVIASHGHTVFHQPSKKFTLQIGDGRAIKLLTNIP